MDNNNYNNNYTTVGAPKQTGGKNSTSIIAIIGVVCGIIGLGLGLLSIAQIGQINGDLNAIKADLYGDDVDSNAEADGNAKAEDAACVLPKDAKDIDYLLIGYNNGEDQVFVDSAGAINYYNTKFNTDGDASSSEKVVKTDTSAIMQQIIDSGMSDFNTYSENSHNDEGELTWDWMVEMWTTSDNVCQAGGSGATPGWFNSLVESIDSKK